MNPFYNHTSGVPVSQSRGVSSSVRAELDLVGAGFDTTNTAINLKAPSASPALTGTPTAPTAAPLTSTTQIATTAYTDAAVGVETDRAVAAEALKAPLASPTFTGTPAAPTAANGTNTTQIATTAFVQAAAFTSALPLQTGNAGKFVTTDGTTASWADAVTLTGTQTLTNKTLTGYTETVYALSGTVIDSANGTIQTKTLSANTTFTESLADGQSVILGITAGAYTVTWPTTTWAKVGGGGSAPTLVSTGVNWITMWQVGSTLYGSFLGTT